jgi:hypothetical protein
MRTGLLILLIVSGTVATLPAQRSSGAKPGAKPAALRLTTTATCAGELGTGVKSSRRFCDVIIGGTGAQSVAMTIPAHTGAATLQFDLHNRFNVPPPGTIPALAYSRQVALVAVARSNGPVIARASVAGEFRNLLQLFDRVTDPAGGAPKPVAPGPPEPVRVSIPAGVSAVSIVGEWVTVLDRNGEVLIDTAGRSMAIVSNLRIEYRPR